MEKNMKSSNLTFHISSPSDEDLILSSFYHHDCLPDRLPPSLAPNLIQLTVNPARKLENIQLTLNCWRKLDKV